MADNVEHDIAQSFRETLELLDERVNLRGGSPSNTWSDSSSPKLIQICENRRSLAPVRKSVQTLAKPLRPSESEVLADIRTKYLEPYFANKSEQVLDT
jgi:hypothetical protein